MSEKKYADDDPERTLVTLDQLSQTIEVMTSVVNRLRRHLSDQIKAQIEAQVELEALAAGQATVESQQLSGEKSEQERERESFVVEISQQEIEPVRKSTKILH
ncbi:MAG: hypothetical protein COB20_13440 [SAR86 cluster bacterium]|uniref:Uncharacterized protein n=1 Tax=SAR86 cluster bacterium TaxID=2030880 RepID=A0A2A4WY90_9GAMM|nr:MAG: hypothetical protein COB20_13440 [SAR86 cluster bacterium]